MAAITIIMYVLMFATSLYTGYSYGVAPMISFYYGEQNQDKLKKLIRLSMKIIGFIGAVALMISLAVTEPLVAIFARPDNPVYDLAVTGNRICSSALVFIGFNVFASGMFTALSNGLVSAVLAFSRSFVFMVAAMLILPAILGVTGAWLATPAAEAAAFLLSAVMFINTGKVSVLGKEAAGRPGILSQGPGLPEASHVQKTVLCTIFFICFHYFPLDLISKTLWSNDLTPVNMTHDPYPHDRWNSIYSYCHTFMIFS